MKDEKLKLKKKGFQVDIGYVGHIENNNTQLFPTKEKYDEYINSYNQSVSKKNDLSNKVKH